MAEPRDPDLREIRELVWQLESDAPAGATIDRLEELLKSNHWARREFIYYTRLLADLEFDPNSARRTPPTPAKVEPPILGFLGTAVNLSVAWFSSPKALALTVAGGLLTYFVVLVISIAISRTPAAQDSLSKSGAGVGTLAASDRARWSKETSPPADDVVRVGQRYELLNGRVDVALARGARVVIDGPTTWLLESEQRLRLDAGKLAARVPESATGFTVATPLAEVVDLGTEFGVEVDRGGKTEIHVLKGKVEVKPAPTGPTAVVGATQVVAGQAVRVVAAGAPPTQIPVDRRAFAGALRQAAAPPARPNNNQVTKIWLGNLFDDRPHVPLAQAMQTDTFRAAADFNDLGVWRVVCGTSPIQEIAPGLRFDFTNLGWDEGVWPSHGVFNDAWNNHELFHRGGIRLEGKPMEWDGPRTDEGIGMQASAMVIFDLEDIRAAGGLAGRSFEFVCDRAGINDSSFGSGGTVHLAVLVSSGRSVETAWLDGAPAEVAQDQGLWSFTANPGAAVSTGSVAFRVPAAADAKYLTLVAASAGDNSTRDQAVWINARLERVP